MTPPGSDPSAIFRLLLLFYPSRFREEYGTDVAELHSDRLQEARGRGGLAVAAFWLRTLTHTPIHGLMERGSELRGFGAPARDSMAGVLRSVTRRPGLSVSVVATLAMGIGANVALFAVVRGALLRPLPFAEPDRLVQLWEQNPRAEVPVQGPSPWNFVDWSRAETGLESMAAWYLTSGTYRTDEWMEEIRSAQVTPELFRVLGVTPALGRDFQPEEVTGYGPLILSHSLWLRRFGGDPGVIGGSITASGQSYEIVGVMPPDFAFPDRSVEAWMGWNLEATYAERPNARSWRFLGAVGRRAPGVSDATAEATLAGVASQLAEAHPATNDGWTASITRLHDEAVGDSGSSVWLVFAAVLGVLLVACANVANLLLAAAPARSRELAVRSALGASRRRLVAELLGQYAVLATLAGGIGLALGSVAVEALLALDPGSIPRPDSIRVDGAVFVFAFGASLATLVLFGIAPASWTLRGARERPLRSGTRVHSGRDHRIREGFVGLQAGLAVLILASSLAVVRSFDRLRGVDPGFAPERLATFRVSLDPREGTAEEIIRYYQGLEARLSGIPGVSRVGAAQTLPLNTVSNDFQRPYRALGSTEAGSEAQSVQMRIVTPGYRSAMGIALRAGADIPRDAELGGPRVALINETLAGRLWSGVDPVGRSFEIDFRDGWQTYRVVGVVADVAHYGVREASRPEVFLSQNQTPYLAMTLVARVEGEPEDAFPALAQAVAEHDPPQPAHHFVSMDALVRESVATDRFLSTLLSLFAALTLGLATTGIYGVVAYVVGHRRTEIGIRVALGADAPRIVASVTRRALLAVLVGSVTGLVAFWLGASWLQRLLFEVRATDVRTTLGSAAILLVVAALAAILPALRATRLPAASALRSE